MMDGENKFVLGLISGEGNFSIKLRSADGFDWKVRPSPTFAISLHESDREVLEKSKEVVGTGNLRRKTSDQYTWAIESIEGVMKIKNFVEENASHMFKSTEKYDSFIRWSRGVNMYEGKNKKTNWDRESTIEIIKIAKSVNKNGYKGKSEEEWLEMVPDG